MNKSLVWGLLCLALTFVQPMFAQHNCDENIKIAKIYLDHLDKVTEKLRTNIQQSVAHCASTGNPEAQYIDAIVSLQGNPSEHQKQIAFTKTKQLAENNDLQAQRNLAIMYKVGCGTEVNLAKSLEWFEKACDEGDSFTKYAIGYFQMKGIGRYPAAQDYSGAQDFFMSGTEPMAEHWFSVMQYFGYGITANQSQALSRLDANPTTESKTLANFLRTEYTSPPPISTDENFVVHNIGNHIYNNPYGTFYTPRTDIKPKYTGKIIEFDWKDEQVTRVLEEFELEVLDKGTDNPTYKMTIGNTTKTGALKFSSSGIGFEKPSFPISELYKSNPNRDSVHYKIDGINLIRYVETKNSPNYIKEVGKLYGSIEEYNNEPFPPLYVILEPVVDPTAEPQVLNYRLAPNPTTGTFKAYYTLTKPENSIIMEVWDHRGWIFDETGTLQQGAGDHEYTLNIPERADPGVMQVYLWVNGEQFVQQIVKQ
ncbi:tetratricopeptide repeat protein [Aquimarina algiphila]|uniref:Sel1 repeat family protein n=1 Tax=Aquimarina algiphila TaxID=2047982 RepID=A0A554VNN4_9FLAO|nr:tetratricopeptide repeat protein [Aquimarina algiphila]TSE09991.1 sel1 repeat family protein [Aquimarina algiphila]